MKYALRTVTWRFKETDEQLPELKPLKNVIIKGPADVHHLYGPLFVDQVRERFVVFWLNTRNGVIGFEVVSEGTLGATTVHPREVFHGAILVRAASIITAHNHPSGQPEPSTEDVTVCRQIQLSGDTLGIPLRDNLIITNDGYTSFAERGLL